MMIHKVLNGVKHSNQKQEMQTHSLIVSQNHIQFIVGNHEEEGFEIYEQTSKIG